MAQTLGTAARNAAVAAVVTLLDAGTGPGKLRLRAGTTLIAEFTLEDPAFGVPSDGTATANGFPKTVNAVATGVVDNFQFLDSDDNVIWSGDVEEGSGPVNLDNTDINAGQAIELAAPTHTQPATANP